MVYLLVTRFRYAFRIYSLYVVRCGHTRDAIHYLRGILAGDHRYQPDHNETNASLVVRLIRLSGGRLGTGEYLTGRPHIEQMVLIT